MQEPTATAAALHAPINLTNFADRLPAEIIENILRHFVMEDLRDISLCNKAWRARTIPVLFRFMDLRSITHADLQDMSIDLDDHLAKLTSCRHLYVSLNPLAETDRDDAACHAKLFILLQLLSHLPNIRRLAVEYSGDGQSSSVTAFVKLLSTSKPCLHLSVRLRRLNQIQPSFWVALSDLPSIRCRKLILKDDAESSQPLHQAIYLFPRLHLTDCSDFPDSSGRCAIALNRLTILNYENAADKSSLSLLSAMRAAQERKTTLARLNIQIYEPSLRQPVAFEDTRIWDLQFKALTSLHLTVATDNREADHASIASLLRILSSQVLSRVVIEGWYPATTFPVREFLQRHPALTSLGLSVVCDGTSGHTTELKLESQEITMIASMHPKLSIEVTCLGWPWRLEDPTQGKRSLRSVMEFLSEQALRTKSIQLPTVGKNQVDPFGAQEKLSMPRLQYVECRIDTQADFRIVTLLLHALRAPWLSTIDLEIPAWNDLVHMPLLYELENLVAASCFPGLDTVSGTIANAQGWEEQPYLDQRLHFLETLRTGGIGATKLYWQEIGEPLYKWTAWD